MLLYTLQKLSLIGAHFTAPLRLHDYPDMGILEGRRQASDGQGSAQIPWTAHEAVCGDCTS